MEVTIQLSDELKALSSEELKALLTTNFDNALKKVHQRMREQIEEQQRRDLLLMIAYRRIMFPEDGDLE